MIEMKNNTPFPLLSFEKYGRYGLLFDVIAIKMSLRIKNGFYADLAEFQKNCPCLMNTMGSLKQVV
ncbi:hypothetical protein ACMH0C_003561 [Escherichia coli]